ncbi:MAG: NAD(P)-dependent oxidoreductase [Planctomycetota bacterium]|nr:MAG: NAD(P)-dependent oxidoreductase [Planctomycetota bacterium]
MPWSDKVALVTGGSSGLGLAIAGAFADAGCRVAIAARDAAKLAATEAELRERFGDRVMAVAADATRDEDAARMVAGVIERFGRLDVLVNNVGRSTRAEVLEVTPEQMREMLEINLISAVRCTRAAASALIARRGHVVNIGSLASKAAGRLLGAYPASKFALAGYTQQLRLELEPQGLHVLLVCPGPIARDDAGERYDAAAAGLPEAARRPGGGVKLRGIDPADLARRIVVACERRKKELVVPAKARLLFALAQLSPGLGDWLVRRMT